MKEFYINNKPLIILWLLCIAALIVFTGHYSNILVDIGREVYYPQEILEGKVLYKDLFNIYGPFSYLWNAFLYKIFGINLFTLYFSGAVCSIGIVSGVYLLAKKFLNTQLSFAIAFFTIVTGICADHLFNFTFPYSQAMLYGTTAALFSIYFLIKYNENKLSKFLYLSGLLAGLAVANKYEFIVYSIFLFIFSLLSKKRVIILNFIISFLLFPLISFGILFIQGLTVNDLITATVEIKKMTQCDTLKYFYTNCGIFFNYNLFKIWGFNILTTGIPFALMLLSYKIYSKNKALSVILISFFAIFAYLLCSPEEFVFLIPLTFLLTLFVIKDFKNNIPLLIFVTSAILISVKTMWALLPLSYGNYYLPMVLTAFFGVLFTLINKKYQNIAAIFLTVISLCYLNLFINKRNINTEKISSPQGAFYTNKDTASAVKEVLSLLNDYEEGTAVVYPEGLMINFLSKNSIKADDYYNSMIPLYVESMGEENFIKNLNNKKPEFIIFTNQDTSDYYFKNICKDYALDFCKVVTEDYEFVKQTQQSTKFTIFKRRKK